MCSYLLAIYILIYKWSISFSFPGTIFLNKRLASVLWDNPEGWDGEEDERGVQEEGDTCNPWMIHANVWQKPPQYCK